MQTDRIGAERIARGHGMMPAAAPARARQMNQSRAFRVREALAPTAGRP